MEESLDVARHVEAESREAVDFPNAFGEFGSKTISADAFSIAPPITDPEDELIPDMERAAANAGVASLDRHLHVDQTCDSLRFFGSSSCFTFTTYVLDAADKNGFLKQSKPMRSQIPSEPKRLDYSQPLPATDSIQVYIQAFFASYGDLGFLEMHTVQQQDLTTYLILRENNVRPSELQGATAYHYFFISMICAVGCAVKARDRPELNSSSMSYYADAKQCIEEVTSSVSEQSLQALLLLTLFCLFYPTEGDIWRLLAYCSRLSVELEYHTEPIDLLDSSQPDVQRSTFWSLYLLEKQVSQSMGRSSDIPETSITVKYPHGLVATGDLFARAEVKQMSHIYRLAQIRSEIWDAIYLPAVPEKMEDGWYQERMRMLSEWKTVFDAAGTTGVISVSAEVLYHSTICMTLQSCLLRALDANGPITGCANNRLEDSYHAACTLVEKYLQIIRAPQDSALGTFTFTFLSAHDAFTAGFTIMGHAMFALSSMRPISEHGHQRVDFKALWSISNSAMLLLAWCAERWSGLNGMLECYKNLSDCVVPAMFRRGLT